MRSPYQPAPQNLGQTLEVPYIVPSSLYLACHAEGTPKQQNRHPRGFHIYLGVGLKGEMKTLLPHRMPCQTAYVDTERMRPIAPSTSLRPDCSYLQIAKTKTTFSSDLQKSPGNCWAVGSEWGPPKRAFLHFFIRIVKRLVSLQSLRVDTSKRDPEWAVGHDGHWNWPLDRVCNRRRLSQSAQAHALVPRHSRCIRLSIPYLDPVVE